MSQLYVPHGAITTCLEGKKNSQIKVSSQKTVFMNQKLKATEDDRFQDNFYCQKMVGGTSSLVGWISGAMGALGGPLGAFVGYYAGRFVGGFLGNQLSSQLLPSLCSTLCQSSQWSSVHPKVKISGKRALLEKATLQCIMGGVVHIVLPQMHKALTHARMAAASYEDVDFQNPENNKVINGFTPVNEDRAIKILGDRWKELLNQDLNNGFYAALYEDREGNVVIAYRGTEPSKTADLKEDYLQAMGIRSDQYDAAVKLAKKVKQAKNSGDILGQVSITGHSLGGGLATIAGAATGYETYTYNAAAVHNSSYQRNGVEKNTEHIQAYIGTRDILNTLQDQREMVLSGAVLGAPAVMPVLGGVAGGATGTVVGGSLGAVSTLPSLNPSIIGSGTLVGANVGGTTGTVAGLLGGGLLGTLLSASGIWGLATGGMPRQEGVQRIVVPQSDSDAMHAMEPLIVAMEKMFAKMGGGKPVKALLKN
ncbi:DUF4280 domain-containing protein [Apibacter muscae]|uniref:PAAR-like protein n=1 Tax=Apibacter muscae TaxID=2509004 RepID=UPI0011ABD25D|nr:PAAR-like protein [Apibacter muscae]TWP25094.1 DUF4280 domain-containing protein [Apibacter muscae]